MRFPPSIPNVHPFSCSFRKERLLSSFLAVRNTLRLTNNNGIIFQEALKGSLARRQDQGYANHRAAAQPRAPVSRGPAAPRSEVAQRLWRWPTRAAARFQWRGENQDECSALCQLRAGRRAGPPAGARIPVGSRRRRATAAPAHRAAQPFGGTSNLRSLAIGRALRRAALSPRGCLRGSYSRWTVRCDACLTWRAHWGPQPPPNFGALTP